MHDSLKSAYQRARSSSVVDVPAGLLAKWQNYKKPEQTEFIKCLGISLVSILVGF